MGTCPVDSHYVYALSLLENFTIMCNQHHEGIIVTNSITDLAKLPKSSIGIIYYMLNQPKSKYRLNSQTYLDYPLKSPVPRVNIFTTQ
jgi:hypothetical protein